MTSRGGRICFKSEQALADNPVDILRLFQVAQQQMLDIHPRALRLITRNLGLIDNHMQNDPAANAIFIDILTSKKDPAQTLRRMNEAGVLGRFVPDFGQVVAQMQHDMYHHYTVDEHTIRAIELMARVEAGDLAEDHPTLDAIHHKILSRQVLYVAVLLHDIAKGRGGDHSVLGAEVAERLCPRFGFSKAETETTSWLVRHHLLMSNVAFKRDIGDPKTVVDFVEVVQSPERLRLLVMLTVADIRAVGPGVWNGWKGQLLRDLYFAADDYLTDGQAAGGADHRVRIVQASLREKLVSWTDEQFENYADRHLAPYWIATPLDLLEADALLIAEADEKGAAYIMAIRSDEFTSSTGITLYAEDHPGLFARLSGAMSVIGASIVDAKIYTTKDGMALDHFMVQDHNGTAFTSKIKLKRLDDVIRKTMAGDIIPHRVLAKPTSIPSRTRKVFTVAPSVLVDNNASDSHTVIEVMARNRPGLVSEITYAFFDLKLTISSAHITTFGERAVDTFYVRDLFGHKVTHEGRLAKIEARLLEALEETQLDDTTDAGNAADGKDENIAAAE